MNFLGAMNNIFDIAKIVLYFAGAIPATKEWVDVVRPIIEKRIQK